MSESESSLTKTGTLTGTTESSTYNEPTDRWTNNITYRQLVASSCVSIIQFWWHPYVHDLKRLMPFLFLYNIFIVLIGYPILYLELALGVVTRKGPLNCWDLSPLGRGVGITMLITSALTALSTSVVAAWCLALLVHSFHSFLPWVHCAGAVPACAARHRTMPHKADTPAQSFIFNYVLRLKLDGIETGMGAIVTELTVYFTIVWALVYCICIKRLYSISKLVMFKDMLAFFVLVCCGAGATQLSGAGRMFREAEWGVLYGAGELQLWVDAILFALVQVMACQGVLTLLGSYCPPQHSLMRTSILALVACKGASMVAVLILGAAHGALLEDYETTSVNIRNGSSASMVLWADFVARIPGSQFWSAIVFFTLFILALTTTALLVHTIMSTFTGRSVRKIAWAFLILTCLLYTVIGILILCNQGGLYVLDFVMAWLVQKPRLAASAAAALVVTFAYGQTAFCECVYFTTGEYPSVLLRLCWAIMPVMLIVFFLCGFQVPSAPPGLALAGSALVIAIVAPILLVMGMYLVFKCRVRNIVSSEK